MGEVSNIRKLEILIIQLFPIYLLSFVLASHELLLFLMVAHTISYYISAYSKNFKYRSLAEECIQTLIYTGLSFLILYSFSDFRTQYTLFLVNQSIMHCGCKFNYANGC